MGDYINLVYLAQVSPGVPFEDVTNQVAVPNSLATQRNQDFASDGQVGESFIRGLNISRRSTSEEENNNLHVSLVDILVQLGAKLVSSATGELIFRIM
jgi:hypothetical protein